MDLSAFLLLLMIVSVFSSLFTEGVKKILDEYKKPYRSNTLAGVIAISLGVILSWSYYVYSGIAFSREYVIFVIALISLSWLCAMVGYDKVLQAIMQIRGK